MPQRESLRRKRASRIAAIQGLYSMAVSTFVTNASDVQTQITAQWQDSLKQKDALWPGEDMPEQMLLAELISGVTTHRDAITALVGQTLKQEWKPERMDPVMTAILHCAAYELKFLTDHNSAMITDEYVTIAGLFLSETEQAFVNSSIRQIIDLARPPSSTSSATLNG